MHSMSVLLFISSVHALQNQPQKPGITSSTPKTSTTTDADDDDVNQRDFPFISYSRLSAFGSFAACSHLCCAYYMCSECIYLRYFQRIQ